MRKIVKSIFAVMLAVVLISSITACEEIKDGSKIQKINITLELVGADDVVILDDNGNQTNEFTVTAELYLNYAPKTIERFLKLVDDGFYNDTVVSNIGDSWCEFGGYKGTSKNLLKADSELPYLDGEFEKNGWVGNNLRASAGVLMMKHDYVSSSERSKYNTAKSTVIVTSYSASRFSYKEYAIFGQIVSDDAKEFSTSTSSLINGAMSSLSKIQQINKLQQDKEKTTLFFNEKESKYYTRTYDEENVAHYYEGSSINAENELIDKEKEDYLEKFSEDENYFLVIPYATLKIKEIKRV